MKKRNVLLALLGVLAAAAIIVSIALTVGSNNNLADDSAKASTVTDENGNVIVDIQHKSNGGEGDEPAETTAAITTTKEVIVLPITTTAAKTKAKADETDENGEVIGGGNENGDESPDTDEPLPAYTTVIQENFDEATKPETTPEPPALVGDVNDKENPPAVVTTTAAQRTEATPQMGDKNDGYVWVDGFGWIEDHECQVIQDVIGSDGDINKIVGIM